MKEGDPGSAAVEAQKLPCSHLSFPSFYLREEQLNWLKSEFPATKTDLLAVKVKLS